MKQIATSFLVLALLFGGCTSTDKSTVVPIVAQLGVMIATERVVKDHPDRAAKAVAIADEVTALAGDETVSTVSLLMGVVKAKIDWTKLTPTEQTAVRILLAAIETELNNRIQAGDLPADQVYKIALVASWVKAAAEPYAPQTVP